MCGNVCGLMILSNWLLCFLLTNCAKICHTAIDVCLTTHAMQLPIMQ